MTGPQLPEKIEFGHTGPGGTPIEAWAPGPPAPRPTIVLPAHITVPAVAVDLIAGCAW
jgi:hypothetical protein